MKEKIDVTIATKNSEDTIEKCIVNIKKFIPYNEIIVVDGKSTDKTAKIAERLDAKVIFNDELLGQIRYNQASLCKSSWIAIIDSDVIINKNWWPEVSKHMKNQKVGAIYGWLNESFEKFIPSYEKYENFFRERYVTNPGPFLPRSKYKQWGVFTFSNALIKRDIIIKSKNDLLNKHASEDNIIAKNIVKWNYLIIPVCKNLGEHIHKNPIKHCKMRYNRMGRSLVINWGKLYGLRKIPLYFCNLLFDFTKYSISTHSFDFKLFKFLLELYKELVNGVITQIKMS